MKKTVFLLMILFLLTTGLVFGQDSESAEPTVEELYLQQTGEVLTITALSRSRSRDQKLIALQYVENMNDEGRLDNQDEYMMAVVDGLAKEGVANVVYENGARINNFVEVRREACRVLGEVGGDYAKDTLVSVLQQEEEPMVMSEAVYALAKVAAADGEVDETVMNVIAGAMRSENAVNKDNNFAFASLTALEKIADANNGIKNRYIYEAISQLADPRMGYVSVVRNKAIALLEKLRYMN